MEESLQTTSLPLPCTLFDINVTIYGPSFLGRLKKKTAELQRRAKEMSLTDDEVVRPLGYQRSKF